MKIHFLLVALFCLKLVNYQVFMHISKVNNFSMVVLVTVVVFSIAAVSISNLI